ncbi:heat shock protein Hsp20 [Ligilactobacillus sp. WC1T17]|uniref:Heat shock protein Hsp20 n=1 Tax=Ligilactobacillus ruminis TaxID=1623 RepID=A0ABY1A9B0_9LACO|nr:heat shock protein Hsp20 [Ligilactobacillus ruminis]
MANELTNRFNDLMNSGDEFFSNVGRSLFNFDDSFKSLKSDIKETDTDYTVAIDVPGIDKKDITIDFKDGVLTVNAKRDSFSDKSDSQGNILSSERSYGRFSRQYSFPNVDKDKISAKSENGVLTITLPKTEEEISNTSHIQID